MPNGLNYALDFEKKIETMGDRKLLEFIAKQTLEQSQDISKIAEDVKANKTRSLMNRYILIGLIILLISLGVLKPEVFRIIG